MDFRQYLYVKSLVELFRIICPQNWLTLPSSLRTVHSPQWFFCAVPTLAATQVKSCISVGTVKNYAQKSLQTPAEWSQPAIETSSKAASKCFMFMYFLLPHWVPATWRSLAQTIIRAEFPSGNVPTTRVLRRISRFSRSITLFVRIRVQCSLGKSQ